MKKNIFLRLLCMTLACGLLFVAAGCGNNVTTTDETTTPAPAEATLAPVEGEVQVTPNPAITQTKVLVTMENGDTFIIQCYPEYAPQTCENFLNLVGEGFYNGLTFHRVIDDFVAQGGDPAGNGMGGSDKKIPGEFISNGFNQNTLKHKRGTVAMARSSHPDSASSQFYICYTELTHLDGNYAAFGEVIRGMETIDSFLTIERDGTGMPIEPIVIKTMELID